MLDISHLTHDELHTLIDKARKRIEELAPAHWANEHRKSVERSKQRAADKIVQDQRSQELFKTLVKGDVVKIRGSKSGIPYREVIEKTPGGFLGWQVVYKRSTGDYARTGRTTEHMDTKIVEVVERAELLLTDLA